MISRTDYRTGQEIGRLIESAVPSLSAEQRTYAAIFIYSAFSAVIGWAGAVLMG